MSRKPLLQTSGLPGITAEEASATASPARGRETIASLFSTLRAPPLVHQWEFWHDRQERDAQPSTETSTTSSSYESRLKTLATISDVREFWEVFNNFPIQNLNLRDSIHLFHRGIKPLWEDTRNERGGAWTFRISKRNDGWEPAQSFWKIICSLAIGEALQKAVESDRITFKDDICGVSLSVRTTSCLITVWNRDADHKEGIDRILQTVQDQVLGTLQIEANQYTYYYKRHNEHSAFKKATPKEAIREASIPEEPS